MDLDAIQLAIVFLVFLAVLVAIGAGMRSGTPAARRRHRNHHHDDQIPEDTNSDDIADDSSPSRADPW